MTNSIQPDGDQVRKISEAAGIAKEQLNIAREILQQSYPGKATSEVLTAAVLAAIASNFAALNRRS